MLRLIAWMFDLEKEWLNALERTRLGRFLDYAGVLAIIVLIILWLLPTLIAASHAVVR